MKKVCVITSTRAEYGLLKPLLAQIAQEESLELQIVATGAHLSPEFGLTYKQIEEDGFDIAEKIEILLSSDTAIGVSKTMALALSGLAECFARLRPDILVVLGDRYEIFAAVAAAAVANVPVAHISGGETTQGAFDEAFRHSITKMSYLHFTSTEEYRRRVIQLGEQPDRVFCVGALGVENIKKMPLLSKEELEREIGFSLKERYALVTFHPVTLEKQTAAGQFENLLWALDQMKDLKVIFTKANADTDGRVINAMIDAYAKKNKDRVAAYTSLGQLKYLSAMKYADVVVGNSSSGIVEAPAMGVPTLNIGDRQKGRIMGESIVSCPPEAQAILDALKACLAPEFKGKTRQLPNPYGNGDTSRQITEIIKDCLYNKTIDLKKQFYDL